MTKISPQNPAYALQNRSDHPAVLLRNALMGLVFSAQGAASWPQGYGVNPLIGNRLAVTGTSGMTVNVDTGLGYMSSGTAFRGTYAGYNSASYSVTVPASSATQWRSDYIVMRQHDTAYGDPDDNWDIIDVPGTFSSSSPGNLPAIPDTGIPLGIIRVTPNMSVTNGAGTVVDARVYTALGGPVPVTSTGLLPGTLLDGRLWVETDTHLLGVTLNGTRQYIATVPNITGVNDTPHNMPAMANNWSVSGQAKYMMDIAGNLCVSFVNIHPGNVSDGTNAWNVGSLPPAYVGATERRIPCWTDNQQIASGSNNEAPCLNFKSDGSVTCHGIGANAVRVDCHAVVPSF